MKAWGLVIIMSAVLAACSTPSPARMPADHGDGPSLPDFENIDRAESGPGKYRHASG